MDAVLVSLKPFKVSLHFKLALALGMITTLFWTKTSF